MRWKSEKNPFKKKSQVLRNATGGHKTVGQSEFLQVSWQQWAYGEDFPDEYN